LYFARSLHLQLGTTLARIQATDIISRKTRKPTYALIFLSRFREASAELQNDASDGRILNESEGLRIPLSALYAGFARQFPQIADRAFPHIFRYHAIPIVKSRSVNARMLSILNILLLIIYFTPNVIMFLLREYVFVRRLSFRFSLIISLFMHRKNKKVAKRRAPDGISALLRLQTLALCLGRPKADFPSWPFCNMQLTTCSQCRAMHFAIRVSPICGKPANAIGQWQQSFGSSHRFVCRYIYKCQKKKYAYSV